MPDIKLITENLADELIPSIQKATAIYILTSFIMESGVRLLSPHLKEAAERGADIKVLAGDYLFVTQPQALRILLNIDARLEARLWRSRGTSFHPKAYLFDYEQGQGLMIVGSSNLSLSAFRMGLEWNLAMNAEVEPFTFQEAHDKFMKNFYHEYTIPLNEESISIYETEYVMHHQKFPELVRMVTQMEESELMLPQQKAGEDEALIEFKVQSIIPRPAQELALEALHVTWEEGYERAMVVMATGLGKTYLAGFFARPFNRVLFVAHREEILHQARLSFTHIMPDRVGGLYNGTEKDTNADFIFASIYTLGMKRHRERFRPDAFDLIVVDEFHHAAAKSYQSVLDYFQPRFLLGITATPDRMDGKDVYALCDGNVAYQIHFLEAIQRGWLSPFQYYGIYDETDYSQITWLGNRYDDEELLLVQLKEETARRIFDSWRKHKQSKTIGFCSSIVQADFLAAYFKRKGIPVISLHSHTTEMSRSQAIKQLEQGKLEVIFTVDLFNEGVDIPSVDTLLFVRPTESLTVFTQQVGRGLRLHDDKKHCTIIDLIGNYRNADIKLRLFDMRTDEDPSAQRGTVLPTVPESCLLNLDVEVINLLEMIVSKKQPRRDKLRAAFTELKNELGRRPTYLQLHLHGKAPSREYKQEFQSYFGFLYWAQELSELEEQSFLKIDQWLQEMERTQMSKSYKMVVLLAMIERGPHDWYKPITPNEVAPFFHKYYTEREYRKKIDFSDEGTKRLWDYDENRVSLLVARMPMTMWSSSSKGLIEFQNQVFSINLNVEQSFINTLYNWTKEICLYRLHWYFERKG